MRKSNRRAHTSTARGVIATGVHTVSTANKKKTALSLLSAVIVAAALSVALYYLFQIEPHCNYSRYVHEAEIDGYLPVEEIEQYRYEIDYADYVRDDVGNISDYFGLIRISGWEVAKQEEGWGSNVKGLLLESDDCAYRVDTEMKKEIEIPYLDQSDAEDKSLNVAFFTYIPQDSISAGSYRVGILVKEEQIDKVLWTENRIEVL